MGLGQAAASAGPARGDEQRGSMMGLGSVVVLHAR